MTNTRPRIVSEVMMLFTSIIWGFGFVAQRAGMEHIGPFAFNGIRFGLGALSLIPLVLLMRSSGGLVLSKRIFYGVIAGLALFGAASLQQVGIVDTTAGKAAFITGTYVVLVPLLSLVRRRKVAMGTIPGIALTMMGMYLLAVKEDMLIGTADLIVFAGAFFWAIHVQLIDTYNKKMDAVELAMIQFAVCAGLSGIVCLFSEETTVPMIRSATLPLLYGGLCSVGVAYTLQVVAQKHVPPTHAAIILAMESVFGALAGWMMLNEDLTFRELLGCALMLTGMISVHFVRK